MKKKNELPLPKTRPVPDPPAETRTERTDGKARSGRFWTAVDWLWKHRWAATVVVFAVVFLSVVNYASQGKMNRYTASERELACARVMPEASAFSETPYTHELANSIYAGYSGSTLMGYCVEVGPSGFGGVIDMMVGISTDGSVTGVAILGHSETSGLGTKAMTPEFLGQFVGADSKLTVKTGAPTDIDHISGATVSSTAITNGVNIAMAFIAEGGVTE